MYIIQILLPLSNNAGCAFPLEVFEDIQQRLVTRFGGLTAYTRAPARGVWVTEARPAIDDIVIAEVMTEALDRDWWRGFRADVEDRLDQEELVVRAFPIDLL